MADSDNLIEARFYRKEEDRKVACYLCRQFCKISHGKRGLCGVRENRDGILYTLVYGRIVAANIDPIEKKPLFHFLPGTESFSIATVGCNFRCLNCQNYHISQGVKENKSIEGEYVSPDRIVSMAKKSRCATISYTYTEPTIFFEYAYDVATLASKEGMKNIFVTNGYMGKEALQEISPYLHAANVDLKSFYDDFYLRTCGGHLSPILENLVKMKELGIWVEITTLIIPTLNDDEENLREIARFIKEKLGEETPWHISAFHPTYKLTHLSRTPGSILHKAREIGLEIGLKYVYCGNVPGNKGEGSYCHECGKLIIGRLGFRVLEMHVKSGGYCSYCNTKIPGFFSDLPLSS